MSNIVSVEWLSSHLEDPNLVILDASQTLIEKFQDQFIPGSRKFDIKNNFSDISSSFPNTFPSADQFQIESQKLGINDNSKIIVYDNKGMFASPRVWWMFRTMGHQDIYVLDGGLPEWHRKEFETSKTLLDNFAPGNFKAKFDHEAVKGYQYILSNLEKTESQLIDARSAGRFDGTAEEPRKGLKSGNIPQSKNLPFSEILSDGKMKSKNDLLSRFKNLELGDQPLTFSCGSGITACIILLAAEEAGLMNEKSVYDGSWTEWAELQGLKES